MKTCTRCGLINPDPSSRCECGGDLVAGDEQPSGNGPLGPVGDVAGFWIRLGSDLLDALVLGAIGFVVATVFRETLERWGERAILLGAPITLVYTGVLQSHLGGGRTVAKRLLGLRVLRLDGSFLSLDRSLVRWSVMGVLCYGGAIAIALRSVAPIFSTQTFAAALSGTQLALVLGCALLVPFHPLKRGLHDLLTGSIVIRGGRAPAETIKRLHNPKRDRVIVIAAVSLAAITTLGGALVSPAVPESATPATNLLTAMSELGIQNPGLIDSHVTGSGGSQHALIATGYLPTNADGSEKIPGAADQVVALVRKGMSLDGVDAIVVKLRRGVNLGIYSSYTVTDRVERVNAAAPAP